MLCHIKDILKTMEPTKPKTVKWSEIEDLKAKKINESTKWEVEDINPVESITNFAKELAKPRLHKPRTIVGTESEINDLNSKLSSYKERDTIE